MRPGAPVLLQGTVCQESEGTKNTTAITTLCPVSLGPDGRGRNSTSTGTDTIAVLHSTASELLHKIGRGMPPILAVFSGMRVFVVGPSTVNRQSSVGMGLPGLGVLPQCCGCQTISGSEGFTLST